MKNYNTMLIEEQLKHQLYHQVKFINMNILLVKICYHLTNNKLPSNQQQIIEQARFTYSPLGKSFEKQIKTIEDKGKNQIHSLESLKSKEQTKSVEYIFPEVYDSVENKNELNKIKEYEKKVSRDNMIYYSCKETFEFRMFQTIRSFGNNIYSSKITINKVDLEQSDLVEYILNFNNKTNQKIKMIKKTKKTKIIFLIACKIFIMVEN